MNGNTIAEQAVAFFDLHGNISGLEPFGDGHINDTYRLSLEGKNGFKRYILQRINTHVFRNPEQVMENIQQVTHYLRKVVRKNGGDPERETLRFLKSVNGKYYFHAENGTVWRMYCFVENTFCYQKAETPGLFAASGKAFGRFVAMLKNYPAHTLHETIEKFHDTRSRYADFCAAVEANPLGRAKSCNEEIQQFHARKNEYGLLMDMLERGELPLRVTHNDTKLNNVLIDEATGEAICVIDLDTVMPGLALHDFGDAIRFGASTAAEDEPDLSKVSFSLTHYNAYKQAYLEAAGSCLTQRETSLLPWGAKLMTLECGMRFLTDYLGGDTYFKTAWPEHNLARCRTQLKLCREMERLWNAL